MSNTRFTSFIETKKNSKRNPPPRTQHGLRQGRRSRHRSLTGFFESFKKTGVLRYEFSSSSIGQDNVP